jgi:hypothetical protein
MEGILSATPVAKRRTFWTRQFAPNSTGAQDLFDVTFGLVLPIVCFVVDPIVFKSPAFFGPPLLDGYQFLAHVVSTAEMGFFLVWRTFPARMKTVSPLFAGVFWAGAFSSALIGIAILPVTLYASVFLIGLPGFMPFISAFVYLRNGVRAMRAHVNHSSCLRLAAAVSSVFVVGSLIFANVYVNKAISASVDTIVSGNVIETRAAANRLKMVPFIPRKQLNRIALAYTNESNPVKQQALQEAYREITGEEVQPVTRFD